jgi:ribosomal protein S27E
MPDDSWNSWGSETADLRINCKDCNTDFTFTGSEQDWFTWKGFDVASRVRCAECIKVRKELHQEKGSGGSDSWSREGSGAGGGASWSQKESETADQTVTCKDCNADFVFTGWQQDFFTQKGWDLATRVRCPGCAKLRKEAQATKDAGGVKCFNCGKMGEPIF